MLLRITQAISNGFQSKRPKKTVMVLFDYSKAFDTVWRQQLLIRLANKGIPMQFIRWFASFLTNRQAKVLFGSTKSKSVEIKQGVPQGSVVAPLLFLLFIDDITKDLPANHALFVDDLSIWTTDHDKHKAIAAAQDAIDHIAAWSRMNKLGLNLSKCETATFSSGSCDAKWQPKLALDGKPVPFNPTPKLVGVKLDRTLSFGPHVDDITQKVGKRTNLLKAVGSREWGWKKKTLRKVYVATQRSAFDYAGAAWHPYLSNTQFQKIETAQNKALRAITGQCSSTPIEALRLESGISSYRTQSNRLIAASYQKALRRQNDHPMASALQDNVPQRLKRGNWVTRTKELCDYLPSQVQTASITSTALPPPWSGKNNTWKVFSTVLGRNKSVTINEVNALIDSFNSPLVIYTDGSASAGIEKGGYAAIFTRGKAAYPTVIRTIRKRMITSSYDEEKAALTTCLEYLTKYYHHDNQALICTDSQSLCRAVENGSTDTARILHLLDCSTKNITIQWVPGHTAIVGNEIADEEAKLAANDLLAEPEPPSFGAALSCIKRTFKDQSPSHHRIKKTYAGYSEKRDAEQVKTRADATLLAQLRAGHSRHLRAYASLMDPSVNPNCPSCQEEAHTLEHWLDCQSTLAVRQELFGDTETRLERLSEEPALSVALARRTLLGVRH